MSLRNIVLFLCAAALGGGIMFSVFRAHKTAIETITANDIGSGETTEQGTVADIQKNTPLPTTVTTPALETEPAITEVPLETKKEIMHGALTMEHTTTEPAWWPQNIVLTMDDGPKLYENILPSILDTLEKYHVTVTFFFIGSLMESDMGHRGDETRATLTRLLADGDAIGYHSYYHVYRKSSKIPRLDQEDASGIIADIAHWRAELATIVPNQTTTLGRTPGGFGTFDPKVIDAFTSVGLEAPKFWHTNTEIWEDEVTHHLTSYVKELGGKKSQYIILLHEKPRTAHDLDLFLAEMQKQSEENASVTK